MTSVSEWRAAGTFFEHRGHRIFWREASNPGAPILLLIHGFPTASWDWQKIWSELATRYELLTLDMIGFGLSDKPYSYEYSIKDQADIHDELLRLRGVKEYHLFSHDYGDTVASELIARDLEDSQRPKLGSVAFLNGGLFPETHHRIFIQRLLLSPIGPLVSLMNSKKSLTQHMRQVFGEYLPPDQQFMDGVWELIKNNHGKRIMHKLIHYIPERIEYRDRWVGAIQKLAVPVKLINGSVDPISGLPMAARYRELIPNANVTELAEVGHYPQVQAPGDVLKAYLEFRGAV